MFWTKIEERCILGHILASKNILEIEELNPDPVCCHKQIISFFLSSKQFAHVIRLSYVELCIK